MPDPVPPPMETWQPGDCLLYSGSSVFSLAIKLKTWSRISHVEVYLGNGRALASRNGEGVNNYPVRTDGLVEILRPTVPCDINAGIAWYATVRGRPYDWKQLFTFFKAGRRQLENERAFFCSEFAARLYAAMTDDPPFAVHYAAPAISPGMFRASPHFVIVWSAL